MARNLESPQLGEECGGRQLVWSRTPWSWCLSNKMTGLRIQLYQMRRSLTYAWHASGWGQRNEAFNVPSLNPSLAVVICLFLYSCNQFLSCMCLLSDKSWGPSQLRTMSKHIIAYIHWISWSTKIIPRRKRDVCDFCKNYSVICGIDITPKKVQSTICYQEEQWLCKEEVLFSRGFSWTVETLQPWQCNVMARRMERPFETPLSPMNSRQLCSRQKADFSQEIPWKSESVVVVGGKPLAICIKI